MSKRYPGNFITGNPVALSQTSNNGIWDMKDVSTAVGNGTWQEVDGIYEIPRSLRFRSSATAYLTRTPATAGNRQIFTYSIWAKLGPVGTSMYLISANTSGGFNDGFGISISSGQLALSATSGGSTVADVLAAPYLRDPSAWYHIVVAVNTTQAASSDRIKMYINGVQATISGTFPSQNSSLQMNNTGPHYIGRLGYTSSVMWDGYMTEINSIDGQALDPSYFGYTDSITGIWQPKKYTGTYGNNGFYLPFTDNSHAVQTLGRNFGVGSNYTAYSETIASWQTLNNATITSNTHIAPDGYTTADTAALSSASAGSYIYHGNSVSSSTPFTASMWFKAGTVSVVTLSEGAVSGAYASFSLTGNGAVTGSGSGATNANITPAGNGWYRCSFTYTTGGAQSTWGFRFEPRSTYGGAGSVGDSVIAWGAQLNFGTTIGPYNPSTSSMPSTDWAATNFSITAGVTYDSMVDSPTNVFTSATDIGGVVPGNYPTLNALSNPNSPLYSVTNAGLTYSCAASSGNAGRMTIASTMALSTGKYYWEVVPSDGNGVYGICYFKDQSIDVNAANPGNTSSVGVIRDASGISISVSSASYTGTTPSYVANDVLGFAYDGTANTMAFYKNGAFFGTFSNIDAGKSWSPSMNVYTGAVATAFTINYGQRPFAYTPPTGFKSLNTTNIQALGTAAVGKAGIQPNKWFDINLYGGTGSTETVTNSGFQPDFVWSKCLNVARSHRFTDSVRGSRNELYSDTQSTEGTDQGSITEFTSNGFKIDNNTPSTYNTAGESYVSWQWKQSPTSGFNIISYTGTGVNNRAISHNLGVAPEFIIVKDRSIGYNWDIYHKDLGIGATLIFTTAATRNASAFGSTAPTSSNFYTQDSYTNTNNSKLIAYLWAGVPGFSKFGSYTGNGSSDGPFIYCGFKPRFIMTKGSSFAGEHWMITDTSRSVNNATNNRIFPNLLNVESGGGEFDLLSNGFKPRTSDTLINGSGSTYIYAAFADSPFGLNNRAR